MRKSAAHIKHQKPNTTQLVSCKRTTELTISLPLASTVAFCPASRANLASDGMSSCLLCVRFVGLCWEYSNRGAQARARRDLLRRRDSPPLANGTLLATQLPLWFLYRYVSLILRDAGTAHVAIVQKMPLMFVSFRSLAMLPWILRHGKRAHDKTTHACGKFNTKMMDGEEYARKKSSRRNNKQSVIAPSYVYSRRDHA